MGLFVVPVKTSSLCSYPHPVLDYKESIRLIEKKMEEEKNVAGLAEHGHTLFMTHGTKTQHAIVFYHGFTNCPRQFTELAKRFFEKGYNVYVPRLRYHGMEDRYTKKIGKLTLEEIREMCDVSVDIARGLGEKVNVLGLSLGGVMAAFNAQFRDDVNCAVVIVPSFSWYFLPGIIKPLINFTYFMPNIFIWWDPVQKEKRVCPFSMYHHFPLRPMGHIYRLGLTVLRAAKDKAPLAKKIVAMTNEMDIAVDEATTRNLIRRWRAKGAKVNFYQFSKELKMEHDVIDPLHPYEQTEFVYRKILEYVA